MKKTIENLLRTAPPTDNPIVKMLRDELPANATRGYLECQLVLKSGYQMAGVLTHDDDDTLRLSAIAQTPDKKVLVADHYFTYGDVQTIVVAKPLPEQLVKPVRNGGPLIVPGA